MNISKIAQLCKPLKQALLTVNHDFEDTQQFIGTSSAIYSLRGLPKVNETNLLKLFSVPDKNKEQWVVRNGAISGPDPMPDYNNPLQLLPLCVGASGQIGCLQGAKRSYLINLKYLKPIDDKDGEIDFYPQVSDKRILVVQNTHLVAILMPLGNVSESFLENLKTIQDVAQALYNGTEA